MLQVVEDPKRIDRAIKRATGEAQGANYEAITYEAYAPGGVALLIDILTDNRNRTASNVRALFTKHGGNLGETGSVAFMFARVGEIVYPAAKASADGMIEAAIEVSASIGADVAATADATGICRAVRAGSASRWRRFASKSARPIISAAVPPCSPKGTPPIDTVACTGPLGLMIGVWRTACRILPAAMPIEPARAGPRSDRMSPNRFEPTTTSNQSGCCTKWAHRISM